jgi:hypothetical protein
MSKAGVYCGQTHEGGPDVDTSTIYHKMYVCERSAVRAAASCTPRFGQRCLGRHWDRCGAALVLGQAFASLGLFGRILSGPMNGQRRWAMRECSGERQVQGAAAAIGAGAAAATGHSAQAVAAAMGGMVSATGAGFWPPGRQRHDVESMAPRYAW